MTKAVLIAGGKGERLRPVTFEMAKAMIPVHGRPLVDQSIDLYWKHRVYEIWFSLGFRAEDIRKKYTANPFWMDINTETGHACNLGTGGWLNRLAAGNGKDYWLDHFYVNNADNLFDLDLKHMMDQHLRDKNVVTIACTKVNDVSQYGSVAIKAGKITNFEEKKKSRKKKTGYINGGYYIFSPKVFDYVAKLNKDVNEPLSLENDLFPLLAKEGVLGAYVSDGQWFDTGTFERWEKVLKEWKGINE